MIDTFALALSHGLILLTAWRLVTRADFDRVDRDPPVDRASSRKPPLA